MVTFKNNFNNSEKKSNLAKLLATENLDVQFRRAKTASFNMEDRILTIPIYKKTLDKDALDMFIAHECSHAINTPVSGWEKASKTKIPLDIFNIVEDARIDKMIKNKYPGIVNNYKMGAKWLWKNNFFNNKGKKFSDYNIVDKFNLYFKTNELNKFSEKDYTNQEFKLITEGKNLKSWADVVKLSEKLYKEFKKENEDKKTQSKSDLESISIKGGEKVDGSGQEIKDSKDSKKSDDDKISKTLSALEGGMSSNTDTEVSDGVYVNLPKPNLKNIIVYPKEFIKEMEKKAFETIHKDKDEYGDDKTSKISEEYSNEMKKKYSLYHTSFNRFKKKSNKTVNYLVKEFEMRKQARQYKRAKTDKTGIIDPMKLHTYKFNEDLFKRLVELPEDKNHGMIFLLDWSSSMSDTLFKTVKQLMNLIWFCDKIQIPFEVYAFRDLNNDWGEKKEGIKWNNSKHWDFKEGDLAMNDFELINVLSHRSSKQEFKKCMYHLYFLAEHLNAGYGYYNYRNEGKQDGFSEEFSLDELEENKDTLDFGYIGTPERFGLTTTPLIESMVAMQDLVPAFRKKYRVDKLSFVTLTDGGANGPWGKVLKYNKELKDFEKTEHRNMGEGGGYLCDYHYIVKDRKTKKRYSLSPKKAGGDAEKRLRSVDANFVGVLLKMLKEKWATINLGFFVVPKRDTYIVDNYFDYSDRDKEKKNLRKTGNAIVSEPGYDDYYLLYAPKLNTDNKDLSELDELKDKAGDPIVLTKAKIKSVFRNSCSGKVKSRVILNKFIEKVA